MKQGMLWFDNDSSKSLETKINDAVKYYQIQHPSLPIPNCVTMHPNTFEDHKLDIKGIIIETNKFILPHHIWVGRKEEK